MKTHKKKLRQRSMNARIGTKTKSSRIEMDRFGELASSPSCVKSTSYQSHTSRITNHPNADTNKSPPSSQSDIPVSTWITGSCILFLPPNERWTRKTWTSIQVLSKWPISQRLRSDRALKVHRQHDVEILGLHAMDPAQLKSEFHFKIQSFCQYNRLEAKG